MTEGSVKYMELFAVDDSTFGELSKLSFTKEGVRRICVHRNPDDSLHCMLVEAQGGSRFPAHMHMDSAEITIIVRGKLKLIQWSQSVKDQSSIINMTPEGVFMAITPAKMKHQTIVENMNDIYIEVKLGPFRKEAMVKNNFN